MSRAQAWGQSELSSEAEESDREELTAGMARPQVTCRAWVPLLSQTADTPVPEGKASTDQEADCPPGEAWTHEDPASSRDNKRASPPTLP